MNRLLHRDLETKKIFIGTFIVILGIVGLLWGPSIVSILALSVTGFIAFRYVYGPGSIKSLFSKPTAPIKNFLLYFFLNLILSFIVSVILEHVLKWDLKGNSATEAVQPLLFLILPIMILGEELFSVFILSIFSSKFRLPIASLLSAIIFGLIHYSTYDNGNIIHTLGHILLIQGAARILFNQAAIKSNSILTSYAVHLIFDLTAILLAFYFG